MSLDARPGVERRQFSRLAHDAVRQVLASATMARDSDPAQFALWGTALALTPPFLVAVRKVIDYPFLLRAPVEYVDRVVLADRLFFVIYSMLVTALMTALAWDGLTPTGHDHEVLGALPVRPRTVAAGRLAAAFALASRFALAVNLPCAVLYSAASAVHPRIGSFPRVLAGHLIATVLASLFVFTSLLTLRSLLSLVVGDRWGARCAVALQVLTFVLLVQVFFFLPGLLPSLLRGLTTDVYGWAPPLWYAALFAVTADGRDLGPALVRTALTAACLASATAVALGLTSAGVLRQRELERAGTTSTGRGLALLRAALRCCVPGGPVRVVLAFALATLMRSRRHATILATHGGLAVAAVLAVIAASVIKGRSALDTPQVTVLAVPLMGVFFTVLGLRSACAVPVDLDANWPFRLRLPPVTAAVCAMRLLLLAGAMPWAIAAGALGVAAWGPGTGVGMLAVDAAAAAMLVEGALLSWTGVPFAAAHEPSVETVRTRWQFGGALLLAFGPGLAAVHGWALSHPGGTGDLTVVLLAAWAVLAIRGKRRRNTALVDLDAQIDDQPATLRLSAALD